MRLSDAIALGRLVMTPKITFFTHADRGCALQMAIKAVGRDENWSGADSIWDWLNEKAERPCRCGRPWVGQAQSQSQHIVHIFDWHVMRDKTWTLDQLINWVRSIEPPEPEESLSQGPQRGVSASPMSESPSQEVWVSQHYSSNCGMEPDRHGECEEVA